MDIVVLTFDIVVSRIGIPIVQKLRYCRSKASISGEYDIVETSISKVKTTISVLYDIVKTTISKNKTSISVVNDIVETSVLGDKTSISIYHDIEVPTISVNMDGLTTWHCRLYSGALDTNYSARN